LVIRCPLSAASLPLAMPNRTIADGQKRSNEDAPLTRHSAGGKLKHSIAS
jgi:hypothetical protein